MLNLTSARGAKKRKRQSPRCRVAPCTLFLPTLPFAQKGKARKARGVLRAQVRSSYPRVSVHSLTQVQRVYSKQADTHSVTATRAVSRLAYATSISASYIDALVHASAPSALSRGLPLLRICLRRRRGRRLGRHRRLGRIDDRLRLGPLARRVLELYLLRRLGVELPPRLRQRLREGLVAKRGLQRSLQRLAQPVKGRAAAQAARGGLDTQLGEALLECLGRAELLRHDLHRRRRVRRRRAQRYALRALDRLLRRLLRRRRRLGHCRSTSLALSRSRSRSRDRSLRLGHRLRLRRSLGHPGQGARLGHRLEGAAQQRRTEGRAAVLPAQLPVRRRGSGLEGQGWRVRVRGLGLEGQG
eukprot:scaffold37235_cov63-Phaeocystis_antarctica.AAC.2